MKPPKIALLAAVVAAIISFGFLFLTDRAKRRIETENEGLRKRLAESDEQRVAAEKRQDEYAVEVNRLRAGQEELLKLRAEVSTLRGDVRDMRRTAEEAAKASKIQKAQNAEKPPPEPLRAPEPVLSALGRNLADVGAATPEEAVTTFLWAATNGRVEKIAEMVERPEHLRDDQIPRLVELIANRMSNQVAVLEFLEIKKVAPQQDGTLSMTLMYRDRETGKTLPFGVTWRQHQANWKVVFSGVPKDF